MNQRSPPWSWMGELNRSLRVSASLDVVLLVYLVCRVAGCLVSRFLL